MAQDREEVRFWRLRREYFGNNESGLRALILWSVSCYLLRKCNDNGRLMVRAGSVKLDSANGFPYRL